MQKPDKSELRIKKEEFFEIWRAGARGTLLHARSAFFIAAAAAFSPRRRQVPVFIRTPVRFSSPRSGGSLEPGLSRRRKASASSYSKPGALSKAKLLPRAAVRSSGGQGPAGFQRSFGTRGARGKRFCPTNEHLSDKSLGGGTMCSLFRS